MMILYQGQLPPPPSPPNPPFPGELHGNFCYVTKINDCMLVHTAHLDLSTVCEELATVKYKWRDIGLKLHVPYHKLKDFDKGSNPLVEVINYWLNGNVKDVPVTWRSLVTVLESSSVDERGLAKTVMNKYCRSESSDDCKGRFTAYMYVHV